MERRPELSALIDSSMVYPSRNRILHKVKSVKHVGRFLYLTMECNTVVKVKDSKRGRVARWITKNVYWKLCRRCKIPKSFIDEYPPLERLEKTPK